MLFKHEAQAAAPLVDTARFCVRNKRTNSANGRRGQPCGLARDTATGGRSAAERKAQEPPATSLRSVLGSWATPHGVSRLPSESAASRRCTGGPQTWAPLVTRPTP